MYCYCLFCLTDKCDYVARAARIIAPCQALLPTQVQRIRKQGEMLDVKRNLFPGYLFLYAEDAPLNIPELVRLDGVVRCLHDRDDAFELKDNDELFANVLYERGGVLGKTKVYRVGDRIHLNDENFAGLDAVILKVDVRKRRMKIEIPFAHTRLATWVEYEVTEDRTAAPQGAEKAPDGEPSA